MVEVTNTEGDDEIQILVSTVAKTARVPSEPIYYFFEHKPRLYISYPRLQLAATV